MSTQKSYLTPIRINPGRTRAAVFVHGFSGDRDDTWDRFPALLGMDDALRNWDIYTVGYDTSLVPDVGGVWSADPDLPVIATQFLTELAIKPLAQYSQLALVAHSMGGLVVQRAILDAPPEIRERVRKVALFGTPSAGLAKAVWVSLLKPQLKNMAIDSAFIQSLRKDWDALGATLPFELIVVAGSKDQFVPPESSLGRFPKSVRRVVPGNHLEIVKPAGPDAESVRLLIGFLSGGPDKAPNLANPLRLAAELPAAAHAANEPEIDIEIDVEVEVEVAPTLDQAMGAVDLSDEGNIVDAALALERAGKRAESIALLQKNIDVGTDVRSALGGRYKRLWLTLGSAADRERALDLYMQALNKANERPEGPDYDQVHYAAINVAFMLGVAKKDWPGAKRYAEIAMNAAKRAPKQDMWSTATLAEASLHLGLTEQALQLYKSLPALAPQSWQLTSSGQQAYNLAIALGNQALAEELDAIFSPGGGKIFISYSHQDKDWLERFRKQLAPYLGDPSARLAIWDDTMLDPGALWQGKLQQELEHCRVAILMVSDHSLNSSFIMQHELPVLLARARAGRLRLHWFLLSPCPWDATKLSELQSTYPVDPSLAELDSEAKQQRALYEIARRIAKEAK